MKGLVLAAGYGERLRPLTATVPKPLLEIGGRPLIHYPLLLLRHAGIREVAVNLHHLGGKIEAALGRGSSLGLAITYSREPVLLGTGGPVAALRSYFKAEPFVILNSDTIMDLDLPAMIGWHRERGAIATLALRASASPERYSQIEIDADHQIRRMRLLIDREPGEFNHYPATLVPAITAELKAFMYCGAIVCEPTVLEMVPAQPRFSLISDLLAPLVTQGLPLFGYIHEGFFRTVDDLTVYQQLCLEFAACPPILEFMPGRCE
jgi:mannose-1-phosphate guanylyltransferase